MKLRQKMNNWPNIIAPAFIITRSERQYFTSSHISNASSLIYSGLVCGETYAPRAMPQTQSIIVTSHIDIARALFDLSANLPWHWTMVAKIANKRANCSAHLMLKDGVEAFSWIVFPQEEWIILGSRPVFIVLRVRSSLSDCICTGPSWHRFRLCMRRRHATFLISDEPSTGAIFFVFLAFRGPEGVPLSLRPKMLSGHSQLYLLSSLFSFTSSMQWPTVAIRIIWWARRRRKKLS